MSEEIVLNDLGRSLQVEGMMRPFEIVPEEMVHEPEIEPDGVEELWDVKIHILLLDRAVEPLRMGIHLRGFRIRMPMGGMESSNLGIKVFHELASIVGEDKC